MAEPRNEKGRWRPAARRGGCQGKKEGGNLTDKELRRLNRRELLQMLIVQCEEAERLQKEADVANVRLKVLEESYERLKIKLNVKDERLNQKDAKIMELNGTIEKLQLAKVDEMKENGSFAEVALLLDGLFKAVQKNAESRLANTQNGTEPYLAGLQEDAEANLEDLVEGFMLSDAPGDGHG